MYKATWQEFNRNGRLVFKSKSFVTERSRDRFVRRVFKKDSFFQLIAVG